MRAINGVILLILGILPLGAQAAPEVRDELREPLAKLICQDQAKTDLESAWSQGIFSSQMKIELVDTSQRSDLTDEKLLRRARLMAKAHNYRGYVLGSCSSKIKWLAFTPASAAVAVEENRIRLPLAPLNQNCRKVEVAATGIKEYAVQNIAMASDGTVPIPEGHGTLSVSCLPKTPRWLGRQTWYMIPYGNMAKQRQPVPERGLLQRFGKQPELALHLWIEAVRKTAGREHKLVQTQLMSDGAAKLAVGGAISHDRGALKHVKAKLASLDVRFFGENRVNAPTLEEAAWLLWYSPQHRRLLLEPKANTIGLSVHQPETNQAKRVFAVITLGEMRQVDVARTDSKKKQKNQ